MEVTVPKKAGKKPAKSGTKKPKSMAQPTSTLPPSQSAVMSQTVLPPSSPVSTPPTTVVPTTIPNIPSPLVTSQIVGSTTATTEDGARLDVAASGFWGGRYERAFFDVRIFNPHAASNRQPISTCYRKHENTKKRAYEQRVREIEHGSFTPLVLSATGGMGNAATICYKRLASMIATKHDQAYSSTMSWLRCTLSFSLLRSAIQCIRGSRSAGGRAAKQQLPPIDLVATEACFET